MTDKEREDYNSLINLYDSFTNQLVETLQRVIDCENLPCLKMISEIAAKRAEILDKESKIE